MGNISTTLGKLKSSKEGAIGQVISGGDKSLCHS
jgi:hypothetical protein